jgi:hypothetical protein
MTAVIQVPEHSTVILVGFGVAASAEAGSMRKRRGVSRATPRGDT